MSWQHPALLAALAAQAQQTPLAGRLQDLNFISTQLPELNPYFFARLDLAAFQQAVGAQLVAVGGMPISQALDRLASVISHENDPGLKADAECYLVGQQTL